LIDCEANNRGFSLDDIIQAGCRIIDFTLDLCIYSDNLLFGQVVTKRENPPDKVGYKAIGAGDGIRTRDNLLGRYIALSGVAQIVNR